MKTNNALIMLALALVSNGAMASLPNGEVGKQENLPQWTQEDAEDALLVLIETGVVEVVNGQMVVKPSALQQLKDSGRVKKALTKVSSICL